MNDLTGKVVLITGSSTGIGAAAARAFGREGARVAVHYHASEAPAREVAADIARFGRRGRDLPCRSDATGRAGAARQRRAATLRAH